MPETYQLLERYKVTLCLHDKHGSAIVEPFIGPSVYVRFHGTSGMYRGSYSRRQLDRWAGRLAEQAVDGKPVFAYFNNDPDAVAVANAQRLRAVVDELISKSPATDRTISTISPLSAWCDRGPRFQTSHADAAEATSAPIRALRRSRQRGT